MNPCEIGPFTSENRWLAASLPSTRDCERTGARTPPRPCCAQRPHLPQTFLPISIVARRHLHPCANALRPLSGRLSMDRRDAGNCLLFGKPPVEPPHFFMALLLNGVNLRFPSRCLITTPFERPGSLACTHAPCSFRCVQPQFRC
jgi:hypothetical protein